MKPFACHVQSHCKGGRIKSQKNMWPQTHADGRRHYFSHRRTQTDTDKSQENMWPQTHADGRRHSGRATCSTTRGRSLRETWGLWWRRRNFRRTLLTFYLNWSPERVYWFDIVCLVWRSEVWLIYQKHLQVNQTFLLDHQAHTIAQVSFCHET